MAQQQKSPEEIAERAWALMDEIKVCLFSTWDGSRIEERPLTAMCDREGGVVHFLVDAGGSKNWQAEQHPEVVLGFAGTGSNDYVVVHGRAAVRDDRALIRELWSPFAKTWWESPDDPAIRVITVTPEHAEVWDGPSGLLAGAVMLGAAMTGQRPPMGDHGHTRL